MYQFILTVFLAAILQSGYGEFTCPFIPSTAQVFLDLERLQQIATQPNTFIQSPKTCTTSSSCENQICCADEVGCYYTEQITGNRLCGCKGRDEIRCTRSAPLAVVKNSICEPHKWAALSMCFRNRIPAGWHGPATISQRKSLNPEKEESSCEGYTQVPIDDNYETIGQGDSGENDYQGRLYLKQFTAEQLVEKLEPTVLSKIIDIVETNNVHQQSYK